jgi:hypothetical protein
MIRNKISATIVKVLSIKLSFLWDLGILFYVTTKYFLSFPLNFFYSPIDHSSLSLVFKNLKTTIYDKVQRDILKVRIKMNPEYSTKKFDVLNIFLIKKFFFDQKNLSKEVIIDWKMK